MSRTKQTQQTHPFLRSGLEILGMTAAILLVFALFHHVLPVYFSDAEAKCLAEASASQPIATPRPISSPQPAAPEQSDEEPDLRFHPPENATPWQLAFAEHFTDEVTVTDHSYTSPNLALEITTHNEDLGSGTVRWHVVDCYIASIRNFRSAFPYDQFKYFLEQDLMEMMSSKDAILGITGDSCLRQYLTLAVRNGTVYSSYPTASDYMLMYADGSMEVYPTAGTDLQALLAGEGDRAVYQSFHFGPSLLDENGRVCTEFSIPYDQYVLYEALHPRCGIGYYEPGHYCFILAEGRMDHSVGATMSQFAALFEREGCTLAYNLDGGRTAVLGFNAERYSMQSNDGSRKSNDMFYFVDVAPEEEAG